MEDDYDQQQQQQQQDYQYQPQDVEQQRQPAYYEPAVQPQAKEQNPISYKKVKCIACAGLVLGFFGLPRLVI